MKKIIYYIMTIVFVFCLTSCGSNEKEENKKEEYTVIEGFVNTGEYYMRPGLEKQIYSKRTYYYIDNEIVNLSLLRVEGENLDSFEFYDNGNPVNYFVVVKCISNFTLDAKLNKIFYKDENTSKIYCANADITLKFDTEYNPLEPKFISIPIDFSVDSGQVYLTGVDYLALQLGKYTVGSSKSTIASISSVESRYDGVEISFVGYEKISEEKGNIHWPNIPTVGDKEYKDYTRLTSELSFGEDEYWLLMVFSKKEMLSDISGINIVHFDLLFNINVNGEDYSITKNMIIV